MYLFVRELPTGPTTGAGRTIGHGARYAQMSQPARRLLDAMNIQPRITRHDPPPPEPGSEYGPGHVILLRRITELEARVEKLEAARGQKEPAEDDIPAPIPQEVGEGFDYSMGRPDDGEHGL